MEYSKKEFTGWQQLWWSLGILLGSIGSLSKQYVLLYLGVALTMSFFFYRMYLEWKDRDIRAVQQRLIWLIIALVAGCIAYVYCARQS